MTKHFCDVCEKELDRNFVSKRLKGSKHFTGPDKKTCIVNVEVMFGVGVGNTNGGEVCLDCMREAMNYIADTADDREKVAQG